MEKSHITPWSEIKGMTANIFVVDELSNGNFTVIFKSGVQKEVSILTAMILDDLGCVCRHLNWGKFPVIE
jgi:hypothetical protein